MDQIKLTLAQLLSLYMGGRPVGIRDYNEQAEDFFNNYGALTFVDYNKIPLERRKDAEILNFKTLAGTIELQYPGIKKIKKMCSAYIKTVPTFYGNKDNPKILQSEDYKRMTKELMKEAREQLGSEEKFVVKNLNKFCR